MPVSRQCLLLHGVICIYDDLHTVPDKSCNLPVVGTMHAGVIVHRRDGVNTVPDMSCGVVIVITMLD